MYIPKKVLYAIAVVFLVLAGGSLVVSHLARSATDNLSVNNANNTIPASTTDDAQAVPVEVVETTSPYVIAPPKPKDTDITRYVNDGMSQDDAVLLATFIDSDEIEDDAMDQLQSFLDKAKTLQKNYMSPNAPLSRTNRIAYLETRGYTAKQAKDIDGGFSTQDLLTATNDDFDDLLARYDEARKNG